MFDPVIKNFVQHMIDSHRSSAKMVVNRVGKNCVDPSKNWSTETPHIRGITLKIWQLHLQNFRSWNFTQKE